MIYIYKDNEDDYIKLLIYLLAVVQPVYNLYN